MLPESVPPPTYSQDDPVTALDSTYGRNNVEDGEPRQPQILIFPPTDSLHFQKGFLGADGERAAIEGELQIKGAESGQWVKVCVILPNPCVVLTRCPLKNDLFTHRGDSVRQ
jgi:neural Wiskott-Aldrich syndrome protein